MTTNPNDKPNDKPKAKTYKPHIPVARMNYTQLLLHVLASSTTGSMTADEIVASCTRMRPDLYRNPKRRQLTRFLLDSLWRRKQVNRIELKQSIQAIGSPVKFTYSSRR
jgi:hypothetical protein